MGTLALGNYGGGRFVKKRFYILQDYRGAISNAAVKLWTAARVFARNHGGCSVSPGTPSFAHRAHGFYTKHGFREIGSAEMPPSFVPDPMDNTFHTLDLDSGGRLA